MAYGKLNEQGQLISANTQLDDSFQELSLFEIKDEDGNGTGEYYEFYNKDLTPDMDKINEVLKTQKLQEWKTNRTELVQNIEITYNEVIYQGDEKSQDRMSRAINGLQDTDTIQWVAKDNSVHDLLKEDLISILSLAGNEQSRLWIEGKPV